MQDREKAFKTIAKTAGCDVDCVEKCTHTVHNWEDAKCKEYLKNEKPEVIKAKCSH